MDTSDASRLTATAAAAAIAKGTLSAQALVEACLARIAEREAEVQAFAHLDPEFAVAQARAADQHRKSGAPLGPLHGLPVGIKDIIDVAGLPGEHGSPVFSGRQPEQDAAAVAALKAAGAVILGKTVTTELANTFPGKTRNPHDLKRTPGGSSSGSAAGVADHMMPLALGTQTAGSVIRPASFCGIYGIKPTLGLIPRVGALLQSHTLDTIGVYGRSVEDLALALTALAVHDPREEVSFARAHTNYVAALAGYATRKPKLAFLKSPVWEEGETEMHDAITRFAKSLGGNCEEVCLSEAFDRAKDWHGMVMGAESAKYYGPLLDASPDKISAPLTKRLLDGRKVPAHAYITALAMRAPLYAELHALLDRCDAILTPSAAGAAPTGLASTGNPAFNAIWTYLGVPAVTLPLLTADGMPLGVQLIGKRREEAKLLATARWLDRAAHGPAQ